MWARGFITALGVALAGTSIGWAAPVNAAPEGPDSVEQTAGDLPAPGSVIAVERPGGIALDRNRMSGVLPGLEPLRLIGDKVLLEVG
ncbi:hypothetical protein V4U86_11640 [Mycobacterium sp. AMU20-3851]|uniref:hypothetical protein n=1 Tax=Mycobacterium sp. AMU20-3851 TaxID=3122055 RepID=UPI003754D318